MKDMISPKWIYKLTWLALVLALVSLGLFTAALQAAGDTGLVIFWFLLFPVFAFLSIPVHGFVLVSSLFQTWQGNGRAYRWVYVYLLVAVVGHLGVAARYGAFDELWRDAVEMKRLVVEPGQVKLEHVFRSGRVSDVQDVRDALASGANPNGGIFDNRLPFLAVAASKADVPTMTVLLDGGADPNRRATIDHGVVQKPLPLDMLAFAETGRVRDGVELLLAFGADPSDSVLKLGACKQGDLSLYDLAMEVGARGSSDLKHQTCLHHAAAENRVEMLAALLNDPAYEKEGAREYLGVGDRSGRFPLDVAIAEEYFEAALLIARAGGRANKEWSLERLMRNPSPDPTLQELRMLLGLDGSAG